MDLTNGGAGRDMEGGERVWSAEDYETARGCWDAGANRDDVTRRVLERAATRYFEKAIGMPGLFMRERCTGR